MKGLTLGCVNMMNGKRLVTEKITKKKRKEKENGHVANSSSVMKKNNDDKAKKTRTHSRCKQCIQQFFFPPKMAPAQITLHILIVMVTSSIV